MIAKFNFRKTAPMYSVGAVLYLHEKKRLAASKMSKSAVGFGHFVSVFFLLEGNASFVAGVNDFGRQALAVRHAAFAAGSLY